MNILFLNPKKYESNFPFSWRAKRVSLQLICCKNLYLIKTKSEREHENNSQHKSNKQSRKAPQRRSFVFSNYWSLNN